jgi:hypothetical protein
VGPTEELLEIMMPRFAVRQKSYPRQPIDQLHFGGWYRGLGAADLEPV